MSFPGPWQTPPGPYEVFSASVGFAGMTEVNTLEMGDVRRSNSPTFSGGSYGIGSYANQSRKGYGVGLLRVSEVVMGDTNPRNNWGAIRPADAIGHEWETPGALALPGASTVPGSQPSVMRVISDVSLGFGNSDATRPPIGLTVKVGWLPPSGVVLDPAVNGIQRIAAVPGITSPDQFSTVASYTIPGGVGDVLDFILEDPWAGLSLPSGATSGWAAFSVVLDDAMPGATVSGYVSAQASVRPYRSGVVPYSPTSRFRWLYDEPPVTPTRYGWGVLLA